MTVSTTNSRVEYSGNGSTTVFAYTFRIFADSDLKVYLVDSAGTATLKTLTTNYTVSGAGDASGGNVTMGVAPTSSETLVIERSVAYTQSTDYVESDSFSAETHETALDRNTMLTQQNQRDITRSMRLSKGTADEVSVELPAPVADQFILWNSDADGLTTSAGSAVVAADDITVGDDAVSLHTTSGAVLVDSQAGATTIDGHTGVTIQSTNSGNITLDSVADVTLDAAGNDIELKAGGTQFGSLTNSSSDLVIEAKVADKDILLKGTDGSSAITALSLDMSDAGKATFNDAVAVGTSIELGHASDTTIARASSGDITIEGNAVYRAGGTDVPVTDGGTGASSLTDGGVLLGSGTSAITAMAVLADGEIIVGDGTADPVAESGATARTSLGLGTGDSPTFTTVTASTSIIPDAVGGADIGSTSAEWGDVYIADDKAIKLGNDQDCTIEYDEDGIDTTRVVAATGLSMSPHGTSSGNTTELRFLELAANGNNYAGFKAPDSITGTSVYVLPAAFPASNKLLQSTDAGVLTWETAASGGAALTGSTNNTVCTVTGSDAIQGEAALTFDGSVLNIPDGSAGAPSLGFTSDTDTGWFLASAGILGLASAGSETMRLDSQSLYIGDTANASSSVGLTMNQAHVDDHIFSLKSSDVAHGITGIAETDTYFAIMKYQANQGGIQMEILGENAGTTWFTRVTASADDTSDATDSSAHTYHAHGTKSGTGKTAVAATGNMVAWANDGTVRSLIKGNGDVHQTTDAHTALDASDDAKICRVFDREFADPESIIRSQWDDFINDEDRKETLIAAGLISRMSPEQEANGARPLFNASQLQRLHNGAIWQQRAMFETMKSVADEMMPGFAAKLNNRLESQSLPALPL